MIVIEAVGHEAHDPDRDAPLEGRPYWERPARAHALRGAVQALGLPIAAAPDHGMAAIRAVHDAPYLAFLADAMARWTQAGLPGPAVRGAAFAVRHMHHAPRVVGGQAGYYLSGLSSPLLAATWPAAVTSAHAAVEAAERILAGARSAYALCRPPGHHAYADLAGGFCYLNNVAIAAQHLLARGSGTVAILDFDVHHGNGTQHIFYARDDVRFVSVHGDPASLYPYFAGYAEEIGTGAGLNATLNLPLPPGTGDAGFVAAIERGLETILRQPPSVLLVSLGFDAHLGDPTANLAASREGFRRAGALIKAAAVPTLLVQEGGYIVERLADNLTGFLEGFLGRTP